MAKTNTSRAESKPHDLMDSQFDQILNRALVGGGWVNAQSGKTFPVENPATGEEITSVPDMDRADVTAAIDAASKAFISWKATPPSERARILSAWSGLITGQADRLARIMTLEQGKPLAESRAEIIGSAATIQWCAEQGRRLYGEYIDGEKPGTHVIVSRHPVGVVGAITPWNFPASMITRKVGPALAAGCTVVLKPAAATPLTALALGELAVSAGLPDGVLNILTSTTASEIGKALTDDGRVRKISFTGSTAVGKTLMAQAAGNLQKISLELGGNAPFIVFPSADFERAVAGAVSSKFRNAGQTCICANRIYVHADIYDRFRDAFVARVKALKVGNGVEEGVEIGPLINRDAVEKVETLIKDATARGAKILAGGGRHRLGGTYFEPTVIEGAPEDSKIATDEIFGPVAVLYRFDDENDVISRANATPFGLSAYLYTSDLGQAHRVGDRLESGMVGINEALLASDLAPFGGVKESGFGREGGQYGLLEYVDIKYRLIGV